MGNVQKKPATPGQINDLRLALIRSYDRLSGRVDFTTAQGWISNDRALDGILEQLIPPVQEIPQSISLEKRTLKAWKTIQVGGMSKENLILSVKDATGNGAKDMMTKPPFVVVERQEPVDLILISLRGLGFIEDPRTNEFMTKEFCAEWSANHLDGQVIELCLPEDGPQLRRQYKNQRKGESVNMAMERIIDSSGDPCVFQVLRYEGGQFSLRSDYAYPKFRWDLYRRVVFRLRKVTAS